MTPHEQYEDMLCFCFCLITSKEEVTLAETLFTPETRKAFCELKHFTRPSIGRVVSRWWVNLNFSVNYPFKWLGTQNPLNRRISCCCCCLERSVVMNDNVTNVDDSQPPLLLITDCNVLRVQIAPYPTQQFLGPLTIHFHKCETVLETCKTEITYIS